MIIMDNKPKIIKITNKNKELLSDSDSEQDNILNKLFEMSNKILKSQELILNKIDNLEDRIKVIENKIEFSNLNWNKYFLIN
jgi:hypothetical protein